MENKSPASQKDIKSEQNYKNMTNTKTALLAIFIVGVLIISSWALVITPMIKNEPAAYEGIREYIGRDTYAENIGGELSAPYISKDFVEYKIVDKKENILEIDSAYTTIDIVTGEKIYENHQTYFVDASTRKHVNDNEWYFIFPTNVQKQDYLLIDPNMEVPATFVFENIKYIDELEVYVFSCESTGDDFSDAWPEFAPETIYGDQTCKTSIEPVTGKTVQFLITWDMYVIQDGKRIAIEVGGSKTTEFTELILLQSAKNAKQLFYIYDIAIPMFLAVLLTAIFFAVWYNSKSREKEKIIIKQLKKIKDDDKIKIELLENQSKQEKLAIVGKLSGRLSHDLKNPLTVIKGITTLNLEKPTTERDEILRRNNMTNNAIIRMTNLVDGILDFVKPVELELEDTSILRCIKNSISSIEIPRNIKLGLPSEDFIIKVDRQKIEIVFINIIRNAVEAIGKEPGQIDIILLESSSKVIASITDSGSGIPKDALPHIFEPLFTTKQIGTGLGLVSCKAIVENHGGTIHVDNNPTNFKITLPKYQNK